MLDAKLKDKILEFFPKIVLILLAITLVYVGISCKNESTKLRTLTDVTSSETVYIEGIGEVKTPHLLDAKKGKKYIVRDIIPENTQDGDYMMIYSNFSKQKVYIGETVIGSYAERKPMIGINLIGNIRVLIPINSSMAGKEVIIVLTPYYDSDFDYVAPVYGCREALIENVLSDNIGRIILVIMMLTLFIISGALALFIKFSKSTLNDKTMVYYAAFLMLSVIYIICSSDVPQFFTDANVLVSFISFLSLSMIGIAFNGFCEQVFDDYSVMYSYLKLGGWCIPFINVAAFLLGASDPMAMLPVTHLYYVVTAIISIFVAFGNWRNRPENRIFSISIGIMVVTLLGSLVAYYTMPTTGRPGFYTALGLMIFSFGLMATIVKRIVTAVEDDKNVLEFRELAYEDVMTGLGNRSKFEKFFDDVDGMGIEGKSVNLFMFDLNFLKKVNDEFGHKAGDQMLIGLAKCIEKNFSKIGSAYRLGGDEFAAIVVGHADQVLNMVEDFKKQIEEYNKYNEHTISTAIGYSTRKYRHGDPDFYARLFREADDAMYANKVRMHEELGEEVRNVKKD